MDAGHIVEDDDQLTRRWEGFSIDYAGVLIDSQPIDDRPVSEYKNEIVELRIRRAFCNGCAVYAAVLWDSQFGYRAGIHGLENHRNKADLDIGWKCLDLIGDLDRRGRRTRVEEAALNPAYRDEVEGILDKCRELQSKYEHLSLEDIARYHLKGVSHSTLKRLLRDFTPSE